MTRQSIDSLGQGRVASIIGTVIASLMAGLLLTTPVNADIEAGKQAMQEEKYEEAIKLFGPDLSAPETSFEAHLQTGKAFLSLGNAKDALVYLNNAVELNELHADALYTWAMAKGELAEKAGIFSAFGHIKDARKAFEKVVQLDPHHLEGRRALIDFFAIAPGMVGGNKKRAMREAEELKKLNREQGLVAQAAVFQAMDKTDIALSSYGDIIAEFPLNMEALFNRGLMHRDMKNYEAAFSDFKALIEVSEIQQGDPLEAKKMRRLGQYFFGSVASRSAQNAAKGIQFLEAYLEAGLFGEPFRKGFAEYYLATLYMEQNNLDYAQELAGRAKQSSDNKSLKKLLKKMHKKLKKIKKANNKQT